MIMTIIFSTETFTGHDLRRETARILVEIAEKIEASEGGQSYHTVHAINGNNIVALWKLEEHQE
jgi:hypothetical protein